MKREHKYMLSIALAVKIVVDWMYKSMRPKFNFYAEPDLVPKCSTSGSAGFDLKADLPKGKSVHLHPGESFVFDTGVTIEPLRKGWMGLVYSRSGLSTNKQIMLLNGVAVIDPDYRGTIHVPLINMGHETITIHRGDRIGQLCFCPFTIPFLKKVHPHKMSKTQRGSGGFGHTGI